MNKNGDIPSEVQIVDLLDQVRREAFEIKDAQRRVCLEASRKRAAQKRCGAMHPFRIICFVGRNGCIALQREKNEPEGDDIDVGDDIDENEVRERNEEIGMLSWFTYLGLLTFGTMINCT